MAPVQKWLLPKLTEEELIKQMMPSDADIEDEQSENFLNELKSKNGGDDDDGENKSFAERKGNINKTTNLDEDTSKSIKPAPRNRNSVNHDDNEHYEEFLHPNMRLSVAK